MRKIHTIIIGFLLASIPYAATAQNSAFTKVYGGTSDEHSREIVQTNNGDHYIMSTTESYGTGNTDIYVIKTNGLGEVSWSYAYGTTGNEVGTAMILTSDGGLLITGYTDGIGLGNDNGLVMKLNSAGTVSWSKSMFNDSLNHAYDVVESKFGGYFVTGTMYLDSLDMNAYVSSISSTGNFFWTKTYGGIKDDQGFAIDEDALGRLVIAGSTSNDSIIAGTAGDKDVQVFRIRSNGALTWSKSYGTTFDEEAKGITIDNYDYYITGYTGGADLPNNTMMLLATDSAGSVDFAKAYGSFGDNISHDIAFYDNGDINLVASMEGFSSDGDIALIRLNATGNVIVSTVLGGDSLDGEDQMSIIENVESGFSILANGQSLTETSDKELYLFKTEDDNSLQCGTKLDNIDEGQINFTTESHQNVTSTAVGSNLTLTRTTVTSSDSTLCCQLEARAAADSITMCTGDQIRLGATGVSGYIYSWTEEGSNWTSASANPQVSPSADAKYKLVVSESTGECITDSAEVYVTVNSRISVDFARDTFFCEGSDVTVTAYAGMNFYSWQGDGYTIGGNPATFDQGDEIILTVIDNNSCVYYDTIEVTEILTPVFDLGPDSTICENLPITLEGPDEMEDYIWNGQSSSNRTFTTSTQARHYLTVIDSFGCTFTDSVVIQTVPYASFDLGPDTSFCPGGSFTIVGPGALTGYIWNDTASQQQNLTVYAAGTYHLTAFNSYNCPFSDTVEISAFTSPMFSLGADTGFCPGSGVLLNGPAGLNAYLWSNGDDEQSTTITSGGDHALTVTDDNGCKYTDSIAVEAFANPTISLGPDTTICQGESIQLTPGSGFAAYLWSTNEATASITVSDKGTYTVRVTDDNGCFGRDTVEVDTVKCQGDYVQYLAGVKLNLYPNPVNDLLHIEASSSLMGAEISIFDLYGKEVKRFKVESHSLEMSVADLAEGTYQLGIRIDNNQLYYRVIVSH